MKASSAVAAGPIFAFAAHWKIKNPPLLLPRAELNNLSLKSRQPISSQVKGVSQNLLIGLLTAPPSLAKHVNVTELHRDIKNNVASRKVGGLLSFCLFGHSELMWRRDRIRKQGRVGWIKKGKKERRREVKGIYRQEPSISGNGYACFSVIQTCCSFFQHTRGEKNNKGASLRGINRKLMSRHLGLKIRSVHTEKWLCAGLHIEGVWGWRKESI